MTDVIDRAKKTEMMQRKDSIDKVLAAKEPPQNIQHGQVICIDCDLPINTRRLDTQPNAPRCIDCQRQVEHKRKTVYGTR